MLRSLNVSSSSTVHTFGIKLAKTWAKKTIVSFFFFLRLSSSVLSSVFVIHKDETHGAFVPSFAPCSLPQLACAQEPSWESVLVLLFSSSSIYHFHTRFGYKNTCVIQQTTGTNIIALLTTNILTNFFFLSSHVVFLSRTQWLISRGEVPLIET